MNRHADGSWMLLFAALVFLTARPLSAWGDQATTPGGVANEAREKAELAAAATVPVEAAIKAAMNRVSGTVVEAELEKKPRVTWEVEILTKDGTLAEVWVDVVTGAVVSVQEHRPDAAARDAGPRPD